MKKLLIIMALIIPFSAANALTIRLLQEPGASSLVATVVPQSQQPTEIKPFVIFWDSTWDYLMYEENVDEPALPTLLDPIVSNKTINLGVDSKTVSVPEPPTWILWLVGLIGLILIVPKQIKVIK